MKLANLLQKSLKKHILILTFAALGMLVYWPATRIVDPNSLIIIYAGIVSTLILGCYVIFGAIFGVWTGRYTITKWEIVRYFFKSSEMIANVHHYKHNEILGWLDDNNIGYIHVMPRNEIEQVFNSGHFFFKKKKDRLFFKMVWG